MKEFWLRRCEETDKLEAIKYENPACVNHDDELHVVEFFALEEERKLSAFLAKRGFEFADQRNKFKKSLEKICDDLETFLNVSLKNHFPEVRDNLKEARDLINSSDETAK